MPGTPTYSTRKLAILLVISVLIGIAAVSATGFGVQYFIPQPPHVSNLQNQQLVYVPGNNLLFNETLIRLHNLGITFSALDPSQIATNQTLSKVATPTSIILLDSGWIAARVNDNQTLTFLRITESKGAKVVVIGNQTSTLFDALKSAGVINFLPGRNPGSLNAPMAGVRFKTGAHGSQYPSYLESNTTDIDTLIDALNEWAA